MIPELLADLAEAFDPETRETLIETSGYTVALPSGHVTDPTTGDALAVTPYYCAHCRSIDDGEGPCAHKDALDAAYAWLELTEHGEELEATGELETVAAMVDSHPAMPDADAVREWRAAVYA